jgi:hypothetical protein
MKSLHPTGDGKPDCPLCEGRGAVDYKPEGSVIPWVKTCSCKLEVAKGDNVSAIWPSLKKVEAVEESPLELLTTTSARITCPLALFKRHLRRVIDLREGPWFCWVSNEVQLVDAWLSRVDSKDLYDNDVKNNRRNEISGQFSTLADASIPPDLLIILLGVKVTPNKETPNVLLENKPTWLVDSPSLPFQPGHLAYNSHTAEFISEWQHVVLGKGDPNKPAFVSGEMGLTSDSNGIVAVAGSGLRIRRGNQ